MKKLIAILLLLPMMAFGAAKTESWDAALEQIKTEINAYDNNYTCLQFTNSFKNLNIKMFAIGEKLYLAKINRFPSRGENMQSAFTFDEILEDNIKSVVIKPTHRFKKEKLLTGEEAQQALIGLCRDIIKNK